MLQGKNTANKAIWMDVCKPLMPDVVAPKAHQNNCSYVSSANLVLESLCKNLAWWVATRGTLKNHKTVKIGGWALIGCGRLPGTIQYIYSYTHPNSLQFTQSSVLEERRRENEEERGGLQPSRRSGHNSDCEVIFFCIYTSCINWWLRRQYGWILHECVSVFSWGLSNTDYWMCGKY